MRAGVIHIFVKPCPAYRDCGFIAQVCFYNAIEYFAFFFNAVNIAVALSIGRDKTAADAGITVVALATRVVLNGRNTAEVAQVLADYEAALRCLPERTMVRCHKKTEERVRKAMARAGGVPAGVQVIAL
jgi:hypothetical protein